MTNFRFEITSGTGADGIERPCPSCESVAVAFQREMNGDRILECASCGAAFSARVPAESEVSLIYERMYAQDSSYQRHRDEVALLHKSAQTGRRLRVGWERRHFFKRITPQVGDRLLDIGCGTGFFLMAASQVGWECSGVDPSVEAVHLGAEAHHRPVHVGRIEDAKFAPGEFAAITAWEVMEHIPAPLAFLRSIRTLLRSGGVLAGSVPNYGRRRYRYGSDLGPASVPPVHLNFWTVNAFRALLQASGYSGLQLFAPRFAWDVLRPPRHITRRKLSRFLKIAAGRDVPTTLAFIAERP